MGKDGAYPEAKDFVTVRNSRCWSSCGHGGGTHTLLVVLADEDGGEIPQLRLEFMSNGGEKKY